MSDSLRSRSCAPRENMQESERTRRNQPHVPPLNFITVHYAYFVVTCLVCSLIFWGASNPAQSVSYTDSLFLVVSAMTEAGLNTVNLSTLTSFQQTMLFLLILIGGSIFVSIGTVLVRKRAFESRFRHVVKLQKERRRGHRRSFSLSAMRDGPILRRLRSRRGPDEAIDNDLPKLWVDPMPPSSRNGTTSESVSGPGERELSGPHTGTPGVVITESAVSEGGHSETVLPSGDHISFMPHDASSTSERRRVSSLVDDGAHPSSTSFNAPFTDGRCRRGKEMELEEGKEKEKEKEEELPESWFPGYLTKHTTGRNGQFFGLSRAERDHLGGVEYRAIQLLAWIVPIYFVLWQLLGCLGLAAYVAHNKASIARENGINPWWLGIFNGASAFNNSGMSLLDENMIPFQTSIYMLTTMGLMILAGNTAYPLFLRLILWSMLKLLTKIHPAEDQYADYKTTLRFILTYPRRVYTNLFPSTQTWWLLLMLVVLNSIDWAAFELLNIGNSLTSTIPERFRVLDGLFQALAVRSGGFYVTSIASLRIGLQVLYVIMMYISAYPVVITMRHSNVYEERSLGIYAHDEPYSPGGPRIGTPAHQLRRAITKVITSPFPSGAYGAHDFMRQQIRGQLAHDLWWLVVAVLLISCIEVANFERDPVTYSVFNIIFEVVSAYGCVGISPGLPNKSYSFSGGLSTSSKLILCAVMLRGRHRGLPVALDRAVRLPTASGDDGELEEEDSMVRRSRYINCGGGD
ncbi:hypothetical protein V496_10086 [Pseudogymnoascus sp. VKM F-4515 (FW-2607)]|nr:hypothetical protein V496_10086 [Pseudogymnoascus sp. VKM F-4515 (FW-2607)]